MTKLLSEVATSCRHSFLVEISAILRRFKRAILARLHGFDSLADEWPIFLQSRAMVRPQFKNCEPSASEILLMPQVLVADDEEIEPGRLGFTEQNLRFPVHPTRS